ncbi:IS21 family transposase, partial [Cryobacterium sp. 10I5]|uniref:IS21 family transposase n=1 Tax=Cryobacterium sp. 10I5 TaxID=3048581 RepID=UPI002B2300F2
MLEGRSYNEIVEAVGCSRRDVSVVKKTITARGITAASAESMTDADVQVLFPDGRKRVSDEYESPDFTAVLRSMKANRHFTLQQAWRKYVGAGGPAKKYGYSQYCHLFGEHLRVNDLVATLRHEPGRAMLVDWAGDTVNVIDAITGEVTRAFLFVAVLPFSGALFCYASTNMKSEAWLDAHVRAFSFFGGVTQIIVPDNPTTATYRRQQGDAERVVNARYQQLADHYGTAIVPARVRKPRDKAAVESAVNVVNKRVIGYLAEDVWTSLGDLNAEIAVRVREINEDIRRANDTTRWELFQAEEAARLGSLPAD